MITIDVEFHGVVLLKPKSGNWTAGAIDYYCEGRRWLNTMGIRAISSVHMIDGKPQYCLSFSHVGKRIPASWMEAIIAQWGVEDFEEDNHVAGGQVRNFWKPVTSTDVQVCPCKETEVPHEEEGGYVWREGGDGHEL